MGGGAGEVPGEAPSEVPGRRTIGFVSGGLDAGGGLEIQEQKIAQGFARRNWDVVVSTTSRGSLASAWHTHATILERADHASSADVALALDGCDVVVAHDPDLMALAASASVRLGAPAIGHLHLPPDHVRRGWRRAARGRFRTAADRSTFSHRTRYAAFIAVSHHTRDAWARAGTPKDRIHVVHNGIDLNAFTVPSKSERTAVRTEFGIASEDFVVGYVGRIDDQKGIRQLVEAIVQLRPVRPSLRLLVAGEPTRHLRAMGIDPAADLRAQLPEAIWLGRRSDVPRLYHAMDAFVVPSQWEEPFGLVAVEALASGVPVIATRRGALPELLTGPLADLLTGTDSGSIAAAIAALVDEPARCQRFAELGLRHARTTFDQNAKSDELDALFRRALFRRALFRRALFRRALRGREANSGGTAHG